jgi:hypothetical protein
VGVAHADKKGKQKTQPAKSKAEEQKKHKTKKKNCLLLFISFVR